MPQTECYCYFALKGNFKPKDITEALGVKPTKSWAIGDLRGDGTTHTFARWETGRTTTYLPAQPVMDCAKAIEELVGKESIICELKDMYEAHSVLEVVPSIENGRPPVIELDGVIDFCSKTNTTIGIDTYIYPYSDVAVLIPRDKFDTSTIDELMKLDEITVQLILPDLLEWMADMNWPVAPYIVKVLARFPYSLVPHIRGALAEKADDDILKYWILRELMPLFPVSVQRIYIPDIQRIVEHPTAGEKAEELDDYGRRMLAELQGNE